MPNKNKLSFFKDPKRLHRFWSKVRKTLGCWIWIGSRTSRNYGNFAVYRKPEQAHRIAWSLTHNRWAGNLVIRHTCDVTYCCNPDHLRAGSYADNSQDRERRNRSNHAHGARHGRTKFTKTQILEIRKSKVRTGLLAKQYRVHRTSIQRIRNGRNWSHD